MSAPIRIGLVGTGRIGAMHARLIARELPGLALSRVFDVDPASSRSVADELDVETAGSPTELMTHPDVDAVAVCTSTDTHVELVVAAAASGKPIFLEKPISLDLAEVDRALAAVERAGSYLQVGFNRRFDPGHASVREAIAAGEVGDVHLLRISSRDPGPPPLAYIRSSGGIFLDMTVHDFDMARFLTGSEVEEVYALGDVRVDPEIGEAGDLDTVVAVLRHADRTLTTIDNSRRAVYGFDQRLEAFGSDGMATSANPYAHLGSVTTAAGTRTQPLPHFFLERYVPSYLAQWSAFEHAVRRGEPPPVTGADGRAALALGLAAWRSVHEGRTVRTSEIG
jgi:myo-inositol 2-dehydrogenase/D-chiro-inositol 1-dehydrogenase